jgi:hypothetical protein
LNALSANGIDGSFIGKVNGYLNHPFAGMIAKYTGLNLDKIRSDFNSLQQATGGAAAIGQMAQLPNQQNNIQGAAADPLARFRQGLQQLK